jgi:hypothetical protein
MPHVHTFINVRPGQFVEPPHDPLQLQHHGDRDKAAFGKSGHGSGPLRRGLRVVVVIDEVDIRSDALIERAILMGRDSYGGCSPLPG